MISNQKTGRMANLLSLFRSANLKYASDKTIKEKLEILFIKDHSKAIKFRIFTLILKLATCILYIIEVIMSQVHVSESIPTLNPENTTSNLTQINGDSHLDWNNLLYVKRHPYVEKAQLAIAFFGLCETIFYLVLTYNGNLIQRILNPYFLLEILCTVSWIIEYYVEQAKDVYIPVFLNCWLIKRNLNYIFKDFNNITVKHQNSVIGQQLISLGTVLVCLIFSSVCGFEHLQRANIEKSVTLSDSLYYIIITFSTVGYGDITPDTWPSKFFMAIMVIVALVVIPTQLESLASLWFERQNLGASYSSHRAVSEKHIVVCTTAVQYDLIIDFLNEFYAHRKNQSIHTILLSSSEIDIQLRSLLHTPLWKQRVFYINGSALRDNDLDRAKVAQAKAVFIIPSRGIDKDMADQHTILRSWAIKDFAPNTPQFVQLFRPENTINTKFAEYLVCEDEFKYAMMANNCLCPGISTLITLLLHKSTSIMPNENQVEAKWQETYGKLAGNEVHSIIAGTSKLFQEFVGTSFTGTSSLVHKRYNICLIGVGQQKLTSHSESSESIQIDSNQAPNVFSNRTILINPGPDYKIQSTDLCLYIALVKEENFNFKEAKFKSFAVEELCQNILVTGPDLSMKELANKRVREESSNSLTDNQVNVHNLNSATSSTYVNLEKSSSMRSRGSRFSYTISDSELTIGKPLSPLYIGCVPTLCKLLKNPSNLCCLELSRACEHKKNIQAADYKWKNKCILVVAEFANSGLYNFILPLRAKARSTMFLKPIVMLIERPPTIEFLEAISSFPLVYWIQGNLSNINTILKAGIMDSDFIIVVSPEKYAHIDDDSLTDCSNIVAVQNLYRLFPRVKVVTELTKASNIRFLKTRAKEVTLEQSACKLPYMFRVPFASGNVFSASMIDTLLYQTFGKPYLIELIRLLIGISQTPGSGNISSIPLTKDDMWMRTYGNLYRKLISTSGEIPIGLYRTFNEQDVKLERQNSKMDNMHQMILLKMDKLGIDGRKYVTKSDDGSLNFVLINPSNDFILQPGDIVYLLKPGTPIIQPEPVHQVTFNINETTSNEEDEKNNDDLNEEILSNKSPDSFRTPGISPAISSRLGPTNLPAHLSGSMKAMLEQFESINKEEPIPSLLHRASIIDNDLNEIEKLVDVSTYI